METALRLVLLLPLAGVLFGLLAGRRLPERVVGWVASLLVGGSFGAAAIAVRALGAHAGEGVAVPLFDWITAGDLHLEAALWLDTLSAVMILTVTGVGFLIHVYSIGYMHGDAGYGRYFTYLNLFTFAMLVLVLADSLPLLFVGWEGVGLCSYLLIGFWFERRSAAEAGQKAFVVNRIGDAAFIIAMLALFALFGTLQIREILHAAPEVLVGGGTAVTLITLFLFAGATGKSAQLPLHVWLPDAMEGPTPVSALIHAATMVTAGVYLVARMAPLFRMAPVSMTVVATVGAVTALFAGSIALAQNDIKKVLAYSTVSQLGYMFLALGVGAFSVAIFHLVMHAFFKALLFMCSGSVIHAMAGRQDMREMGGLKGPMPVTWLTMLAGGLALAGIPIFAGFFSKDEILYEAWAGPNGSPVFWLLGAAAALLTAVYIFRLLYLTFGGASRVPEGVHPHESPKVMTVPLIVLAVLSTLGGLLGLPHFLGGGAWFQGYVEQATGTAHAAVETVAHAAEGAAAAGSGLEVVLMLVSVGLAVTGLLVARRWYARPSPLPEVPAEAVPRLWSVLRQKYYFDEFYFLFVVSPLRGASKWLYRAFDVTVIDGLVRGTGRVTMSVGTSIRGLQKGHVGGYAMWVALGAALLLLAVIL